MSAQNTLQQPHRTSEKSFLGVEMLCIKALASSLYSFHLTIFKWNVVLKCSFSGRQSSVESTVRQLSRKIVIGRRKKNKLAKGCWLRVASGSVMRHFNSITAWLDPVRILSRWRRFPRSTESMVWRVQEGYCVAGRQLLSQPLMT